MLYPIRLCGAAASTLGTNLSCWPVKLVKGLPHLDCAHTYEAVRMFEPGGLSYTSSGFLSAHIILAMCGPHLSSLKPRNPVNELRGIIECTTLWEEKSWISRAPHAFML